MDMAESEFPPNSDKAKLGETEEKNVKQVTSTPAVRRKKGIGKQFKSIFFGGDARSALAHMFYDVVIPATKEMLVDAGREGLEKLIMGQSRRQRSAPPSGPTGYVSYNRMAMGQRQQPARAISQRARVRHDFDEIVLETRQEAEDVIDRLFDLVGSYGSASVSDLYDLVGIPSNHADQKWGWEELRGSGVSRVRGGYMLDLPEPEPLN
jgi:hypothetical protein